MKFPSYSSTIHIGSTLSCAFLISACAAPATSTLSSTQSDSSAHNSQEHTQASDFYYTVERGDKLSGIAERFTGDLDNWNAIANANEVADPRKLRVGQQLVIPGYLLPAAKSNTHTAGIPTSAAVQRSLTQQSLNTIDDVGPDAANVQIEKANPNKRFVLRPLGSDVSDDTAAEIVENDYIKIIGSYFPKVVYRAPQLNAKLLMRVAPGTTFPLEKLDNGWYQISTEQGSGYLRLQDGKPTDAKG